MFKQLKKILTIAGSDPMGGAGIQADIRVGNSLGLHVLTAITSVTAQNSTGLKEIGTVSDSLLKSQLNAISSECVPDAIKIGMIGSRDNVFIIEEFLSSLPHLIPVVVDPVFSASANNQVMMENVEEKEWSKLYIDHIFPLTTVAIPNTCELSKLLGENKSQNLTNEEIKKELNLKSFILTGGDLNKECVSDTLYLNKETYTFNHKKIKCKNLHGTGCVYSTLIASFLALGMSLPDAFKMANSKMEEIIIKSVDYKLGNSTYGPLNITSYNY